MSEDDEIEKFTRELQDQIMADIRRTYSPAVVERWQNPQNLRTLENPDGRARVQGVCGDTMEMSVRVKDETITECAFQTDGCGTTIVCGSVATELAVGKPLIEALGAVSAAEILKVLGGLPESDVHCAQLAAETLRRALADYLHQKNSPWKKNYRKT
ncbi:MAG TPA: iron-sulfur cluster assembly scaffold protein [Candidatus Desulfaltia sp.]|nr:iron-sulfur cluster assembly scaffold protein [Candidatus Desulfaltia sp.]